MSKFQGLKRAYKAEIRRQWEQAPDNPVDEDSVLRAILAELREPDDRMVEAGDQIGVGSDYYIQSVWQAMLDAVGDE